MFSFLIGLILSLTTQIVALESPSWIGDYEGDSNFYVGIGRVNIKNDNFEELANNIALKEISVQIYADIGYSSLKEIAEEDDKTVRNKLRTETKVFSKSSILGCEKVKSEIVNEDYFVLWRLNKNEYLNNLQKNKEKTIALFNKYQTVDNRDPYSQLGRLIPIYELIYGFVGLNTVDELGLDLNSIIPYKIKELISNFSLKAKKSSFDGIMHQPLDDPIQITVQYSNASIGILNEGVSKIPIFIRNNDGDAMFSSRIVSSGSDGTATFKIIKVSPNFDYCSFSGSIDLKKFRSNRTMNSDFENQLNQISYDRTVDFDLFATQTERYEVGHILISDDISRSNLDLLRAAFRTELTNDGTFSIIMENRANDLIEEWEKEGRDVCSDKSCQQQIGEALGVSKLIFNKISFNSETFSCHMFLADIENQEIEFEKNYDKEFPISLDGMNEDKVVGFIKKNSGEIIEHFFKMAKRGKLVLNVPIANVSASIKRVDPGKWDDKEYNKTLPVADFKLLAGSYKIELRRPGFETKKFIQNIGNNQKIQPSSSQLMLEQKSSLKSLKKSMFFPGRGQAYQSEIGYEYRKYIGYGFSSIAIGGLTITGITLKTFLDSKKSYENANTIYLNQKILEDVNYHRSITQNKHTNMVNAKNRLYASLTATFAIWIINIAEAYYKFPDYGYHLFKSDRLVFNVDSRNAMNDLSINFGYSL